MEHRAKAASQTGGGRSGTASQKKRHFTLTLEDPWCYPDKTGICERVPVSEIRELRWSEGLNALCSQPSSRP